MANETNAVDWLTLAAAVLGTAVSSFTAFWATRRLEREVFDIHLDWEWIGDGGPHAELPFVYIHNRSKDSINIVRLSWMFGPMVRREWQWTALFSEDPSDINFPYEIVAGATQKLFLDEDGANMAFENVRAKAEVYGFFRRSSIWLVVETLRGNTRIIAAEKALPRSLRPKWLTGEKTNG